MGLFMGMFPILPGKEEVARAHAREIAGARKPGFDALNAQSDITRETWAIQTTPQGSFMLAWFEGDVEKAFQDVATLQDEITVWHRAQMLEISGIDLTQMEGAPLPEIILDWRP